MTRLLILVCSCRCGHYPTRARARDGAGCVVQREACRATWLADLPEGVSYAFIVGRGEEAVEADVWQLDAPDDYTGLPAKMRAAFRRALEADGWDWLLKVDDDSLVHPARALRLAATMDGQRVMLGNHGVRMPYRCHGGAGYMLPREVVEAVAGDALLPEVGAEDRLVTDAAERAGAEVIFDARFCFNKANPPTADNQQITAHFCDPEDMRRLWAGMAPTSSRQAPARRPQSGRRLPTARAVQRVLQPMADGLALPPGKERVVVMANTDGLRPAEVLRAGDFVVHLNTARYAAEAMEVPGTAHALLVRRCAGGDTWYDPETARGMRQVIHVVDGLMRTRRAWWLDWIRTTGKSPTTGFIAWHLAQEVAQGLPVVLYGFAPGEDFGTPLWAGHAWAAEAAAYAAAGAVIIRPQK